MSRNKIFVLMYHHRLVYLIFIFYMHQSTITLCKFKQIFASKGNSLSRREIVAGVKSLTQQDLRFSCEIKKKIRCPSSVLYL
jgi:hypothetical protein